MVLLPAVLKVCMFVHVFRSFCHVPGSIRIDLSLFLEKLASCGHLDQFGPANDLSCTET